MSVDEKVRQRRKIMADERMKQLERAVYGLAHLIEETTSEDEADEIFNLIEKEDKYVADKIWDDLVDWNKVSWIPEEAKKDGKMEHGFLGMP